MKELFFKSLWSHFAWWSVYIILHVSKMKINAPAYHIYALDIGAFFALLIGVFYVSSLYIFPKYYTTKRYILVILFLILLAAFFHIGRYIIIYPLQPYLNPEEPSGKFNFPKFFANSFWIFIVHVSYGYAYFSIKREKERVILEQENARLEKERLNLEQEKMQAELAFLKSQFNPHLLYNTLNYFYDKTRKLDEPLSESILKLSDILRYSLEGTPDKLVPLEEEVHHLQSFLSIHQLRFGANKTFVSFTTEGNLRPHKILPLVLISFVENAVKHGDLSHPAEPLTIEIKAGPATIRFYCRNYKRKGRLFLNGLHNATSTGIGMENVKRRLEYGYAGRYQLNIHEDDDHYTCNLVIGLPDAGTIRPEQPAVVRSEDNISAQWGPAFQKA